MANLYTEHLIVGMIYVVHIVKEIKPLNRNRIGCFILKIRTAFSERRCCKMGIKTKYDS